METIHQTSSVVRNNTLAMSPEAFQEAADMLINKIVRFLEELPQKPVTTGAPPAGIRSVLGKDFLPPEGAPIKALVEEAATLLFEHSLFNGHPRFWGYITSSAAPVSALADMLAATVNPNVGAFSLSPIATEIEKQTIQWLAEFIGYHPESGGLFVSGGNMANFIGFLAARQAKYPGNLRKNGLSPYFGNTVAGPWGTYTNKNRNHHQQNRQLTLYCAKGTHTWVQKAAHLFGHGTDAIRWIDVNEYQQMDIEKLHLQLNADLHQGHFPFLVIGNAGSVSTGAVDFLSEIAHLCKKYKLWFHIDGAYGAPAAVLPEMDTLFEGMREADSIALDPHKWLYSALEAGCILVRDPQHLKDTFSFHPDYYNFDGEEAPTNFHDYGMQNSRGFRVLKVWMGLKQAGKNGYMDMIREDIALAGNLFELLNDFPELQPISHNLSITTFRYIPQDLRESGTDGYLNKLNETLLNRLQAGGEVYLSNAIVDGKYCLRVCIVNFRTQLSDVLALPKIILREGKLVDAHLRGMDC